MLCRARSIFGNAVECLSPPSRTRLKRSEEHTSELQSRENLVCRLLLEKKKLAHLFEKHVVFARCCGGVAGAHPPANASHHFSLRPPDACVALSVVNLERA